MGGGKEALRHPDIQRERFISGTASNGLRFEGYIDTETNIVTNFYPVIE